MPQKIAKITTRELTRLDKERATKQKQRKQEIEDTRPKGEIKKVSLYKGLDT